MTYSTSNDYYNDEISRADTQRLEKCGGVYMIGRLRSDSPTYISASGNIQIYIEQLCDDPKPVMELPVFNKDGIDDYVAFDNKQQTSMLPSYYDSNSMDYAERKKELVEHLDGNLIIFTPEYTLSRNGKWFKNMYITGYHRDNPDQYYYFSRIPHVLMEPAKFEDILRKGDYFDLYEYDGEVNDAPEVILCGSYAYKARKPGEPVIQSSLSVGERWRCIDIENVDKVDLTRFDSYKDDTVNASDNIAFIEANLVSAILSDTDTEPFESEKRVIQLKMLKDEEKEEQKKTFAVETDSSASEEQELPDDNGEADFINALQQMTLNNGLQYKRDDLINFHTSVKTNPLTVLAGMSGTGKSRLAMNYAKMLGLSEDNNNLLFMPISPSYTEPSDVLGYLNSMNGLYVPSETGLVQFLQHAAGNPDQMHMVIFDEMNLSQVEYWFSPFISILEKDRGERVLTLYDDDAHCINEKVYPPHIKIGENVIFVGTVNLDDTTKKFSDRMLDRTFVISLEKVSFTQFYKDYRQHEQAVPKVDVERSKCQNVNQFVSWCHGNDRKYMEAFKDHTDELGFFDELDALIRKYIPEGGISHRVMKNIGNYILNVPGMVFGHPIIDRREVLDTVLNQTIMEKIRGTEMQLEQFIGTLDETTDSLENSEIVALLDKYNSMSDFEKVRSSLIVKAKELRTNGYTN